MSPGRRWRRLAGAGLAAGLMLAAGAAEALSLFGSDARTRAQRYLRRADETMTRADAIAESGNVDQALILYRRAATAYEELCRDHADLENGLPRYRLAYCREQIARLDPLVLAEAAATNDVAPAAETPGAPEPSAAPAAPPAGDVSGDLAEARALLDADQMEEASRILVRLLKADPGNRSVRLMIALARSRQGRFQEALAALEDLRGVQEDLPLLLALAAASHGAGRHYDAMLALDKAIQLAPEHPHAYINLAWLRLAMEPGETGRAEAEGYYRQGVKRGARRDWQLERRLGLD